VTLGTIVLGVPEAYFIFRMSARWRAFFLILTLGPLFISAVADSRCCFIDLSVGYVSGIGGVVAADAITLEAEHHIPFAVDDVFLDYQVVGESVNSMSVVLVAVKKVKVLEYVAAVEQAGLEALVVDLDAFAIQNQYELNHPEPADEAVALIDIGAAVMKTNVVRGGASVFARDVPFGGHNYTLAIAQRLNIDFEKAEAAKQGQDVGVAWDDLVPALETVSRDLSMEVQRTFDYFASTAESERIGRIVLSGGCARLAGIDEFLSSSWGVPVEVARPLERVEHVEPAQHMTTANRHDHGRDPECDQARAQRRRGDEQGCECGATHHRRDSHRTDAERSRCGWQRRWLSSSIMPAHRRPQSPTMS
jgi:hypothetical protein